MRWTKNLRPLILCILAFGAYTTVANAFLLDLIFGKSLSSVNKSIIKPVENLTVQNMDVLGEGSLSGQKNNSSVIKKLVNTDSSAFSIEQGVLHNSVERAAIEENSHTMDEILVYTVKKEDTLASIASYFEISKDTIMTFNKLDSEKVYEGDTLEIPKISGILYTIKSGDTLDKISEAYKIDSENISLYNAIIPEIALSVGEDIFLPGAKLAKVEVKKDKDTTKIKKEKEAKVKALALAKAKTKKDNLKDNTKDNSNDKTAISKIKRFAGKFANLPEIVGYFGNPAPGAIRTQKMHGANGVDLAAPIGTNILASAAGTVSVAKSTGWNYGYGQYIVISHDNGTQTVYAHLSNIDVAPGQAVDRGQKIGDMGNSGNSTGPHVHFEVRGAYNPFAW